MTMYQAIFYFFAAAAGVSAIAIVFSKNLFYGALLLIICLLSIAGIYVLTFAEFIAVTQIMVYAGGVLVLIIFGIMLTAKIGKDTLRIDHGNLMSGSILATTMFILFCYCLRFIPKHTSGAFVGTNTIEAIGKNLLTTHLIPFELAGIILLISLIGSAVIASHKSKES